jgi:hypothetical protein
MNVWMFWQEIKNVNLKGSVSTLWHFQLQFIAVEMSHVTQLAVFIRDTNDNFQLMEELLQVVLMNFFHILYAL